MPTNTEDKLVVSGTFTGTKQTVFFVKITDEDGDSFQWKKRLAGASWSSATNVSGITLDDDVTLSDGVKVKFTAGSKTDYNDGDTWTFIAYPNFKISETTSAFTDMGIIEHADRKDLVIVSKGSGEVGVIEDYESSAPKKLDTRFNIGPSDSIDIQNKNKELYIATGRNNKPKWAGYVSHNGLSGTITKPEFIVQEAIDLVEAEDAIEADAFTDFVLMSSDGYGGGGSKLIIGIKEGDSHLYVMNIDDDKLFKFECLSQPLRVRPDYAQRDTGISTANGELKGVAVLCAGQNVSGKEYINSIEFWSMNDGSVEGEGANRDKIIHLNAPEQQAMEKFTDFLIVPTKYHATTHYTTGDFHLVVSTSTASAIGELSYPLFKYENVDDLSDAGEIAATSYVSISPKINWDGEDGAAGKFVYLKKSSAQYNSTHIAETTNGYENKWKHVADCNLVFGCLDGTDTTTINPTVMFTGQLLEATEWEELYDLNADTYFGPVYQDSTSASGKAYWVVNWATFNIPLDATGVASQPMLMHIRDNISSSSDSNNAWRDYPGGSPFDKFDWLGGAICNRYMPPANTPNCGVNRKFVVMPTSQGSSPGMRSWLMYIDAGTRRVRTFHTPLQESMEQTHWIATTFPHIFPNPRSWVYTKYGEAGSIGAEYDDQPNSKSVYLGSGSWRDGRRWRLGDYPFIIGPGIETPRLPNTFSNVFAMSPHDSEYSDSTIRKYIKVQHATDAGNTWTDTDTEPTNLLGDLTDWLTFTAPAKTGADNWVGSDTVKKVFYKVALVYDGYQENALMGADVTFADGGSVMSQPITFNIRIDASAELPRRVKSIVLYRADSILETDTEPDGLYRFVKEIDLVKFNWNSTSQIWEYTVIDSGYSEGSYGSINGVSEGIHSLPLNYSVSTEQNGYLFVGNCNHTQFEDSENFIFRSQPGKYSIFDWSKDFLQLPFVPTALAGFMGKVYGFGATQMGVINPESMYIEDTLKGVGCMGQKSVYSTSYGLFWVDKTNAYLASPQIKKVGTPMLEADSHGWLGLSDSVKESSVIGYDSRRKSYLIFFTNTDNRCWAYNTQDNRWDLWETPGKVMDSAYTSDGHSLLLLSDGTICKYLSGPNKRNWTFVSKKLTLGSDTQDKKLRNVKLDASIDNNSNALPRTRLYYKVDGTSWQNGTDISSSSSGDNNTIKKVIAADNKNHWIQMKATGENDATASDARGYSMGVVYKPKSIK